MERITIGRWESISLLVMMINLQIYLNLPRVLAEDAGTAGWIQIAYSTVLILIIFTALSLLYSKFGIKDILDVSNMVFGRFGEIITGIILILYLFFAVSMVLREFTENVKIISLTQSPISFVTSFFIAGITVGAYFGIQAIARVAVLMVPVSVLAHFIILAASSQYFEISNIMPILGNGIDAILINGVEKIAYFSSINTLFIFSPFLGNKKNLRRVGYISIILAGFFMVANTLAYLLVYPYPAATENFLPIYQLAKLVNYGRFFQRIESVFVLIWAMTAFLYLSFVFYLIIHTFKKTFRLKYQRTLIPVFAVLTFTVSMLPQNLVSAIEIETKYFRLVGLSVLSMLLFLSAAGNIALKIKKKRGNV